MEEAMFKDKLIKWYLQYSKWDADFIITIAVLMILAGFLGYTYGPF